LTKHSLFDATCDTAQIVDWWRRWPKALISIPCGPDTGFVALDIDVKDDRANGFDTLAELGHAVLPDTPIVHTPSGGIHLYFAPGPHEIRNTAGWRGRGIVTVKRGSLVSVVSLTGGPRVRTLLPPPVSLSHR
jgi:hypothetical protein